MSSADLQTLYQELILDHSRTPEGRGDTSGLAHRSHQINPTCGDEITLGVELGAGRVISITWEGEGCAISQASASLLSELATGLEVPVLHERIERFREVLRSRGREELDPELFGDAVALGGVSRYLARVKCAMLGWVALEHALESAEGAGRS
ncbi:Fe-S cluster assembly sulfur transfer protein SufU [Homoserinibacter sp. YIM 151385]|uniref:Fe-S cluster assembly sulfur transfer protein SufU n=1 Tax=Homoserinibacter sp. YIM 151385 TaxID=2985506 RepID=UPI0022F140B0|nr:SUF system NifU family Fe-S cluster assembly protein [Homoserinibacter sp. YIM 151385]WBU38214.1 SUF system NifU family Fe-S cluster assembly protein [Homoserinibacter sp. YIM 151385]